MLAAHYIAFVHAHPKPVSGIEIKHDKNVLYIRLHEHLKCIFLSMRQILLQLLPNAFKPYSYQVKLFGAFLTIRRRAMQCLMLYRY